MPTMSSSPVLAAPRAKACTTIISSAGSLILSFITTSEARSVRAVCWELREAVAAQKWKDTISRIKPVKTTWMEWYNGESHMEKGLRLWRTSFPKAVAANLRQGYLSSRALLYLANVRTIERFGIDPEEERREYQRNLPEVCFGPGPCEHDDQRCYRAGL